MESNYFEYVKCDICKEKIGNEVHLIADFPAARYHTKCTEQQTAIKRKRILCYTFTCIMLMALVIVLALNTIYMFW